MVGEHGGADPEGCHAAQQRLVEHLPMHDKMAVVEARLGCLRGRHGVDEGLGGLVAVAVAGNLVAGGMHGADQRREFFGRTVPEAVGAGLVIVGRAQARGKALDRAVGGELDGLEDQLVVALARQALPHGQGSPPPWCTVMPL